MSKILQFNMDEDLYKTLTEFSGRRNAVITLIIPPDTKFIKFLDGVKRQVRMIKHQNKRYQINQVLYYIDSRLEGATRFGGNGRIICCGFNKKDEAVYYELESPNKIQEFEYHYGYTFHVARIMEIYYEDVIYEAESEEIGGLKKHIMDADNMIALGEEIETALDMKIVDRVYMGTDPELEMINRVTLSGGKIGIIKDREFLEKYPTLVLLRYPCVL